MKEDTLKKLSQNKISGLIMQFAFTTMIALIINSLYTLTDSLIVSWGVGVDAMGAISVVYPFIIIQSAISTALGGGAASIISRRLGGCDLNGAGKAAFNAMISFWISAIIISLIGFVFLKPLLKMMGATPELYENAKDYLTIILIGNVFSTGFSAIIRAEGKMLYGLLIWVIPISINIVLDIIFVIALKWGVKGSAAATVICQFTSFSMSIIFFTKFSKIDFKGVKVNVNEIKEIINIGSPSLIQMTSLSASLLIINNVMRFAGGTLAINTFSYIFKLIMFFSLPFMALMQALSPVAGYNHGAGLHDRVRQATFFTLKLSLIYSFIALLIMLLIPQFLLNLFTGDNEVLTLGQHAIKIISLSMPFMPLPMITGALFQAKGERNKALLMYASNLFFLLPLAIIMTLLWNLEGTWWSYVLAGIFSTILAVVFYLQVLTKKSKGDFYGNFQA